MSLSTKSLNDAFALYDDMEKSGKFDNVSFEKKFNYLLEAYKDVFIKQQRTELRVILKESGGEYQKIWKEVWP